MKSVRHKVSMSLEDIHIATSEDLATMAIENVHDYEGDDDKSFAYARVTFMSTRKNSHALVFSEDVLRKYAHTYLGKFIVSEYSQAKKDVTTHTNTQTIVGYIPTNQKIHFNIGVDGHLEVSAIAVISKIYAIEVYELFKTRNFRSVSVEQIVEMEQTWEDGEEVPFGKQDIKVVGFEGFGITILGLDYRPSVPSMNMKIMKFSKQDAKETFEKQNVSKNKTDIQNLILSKLDSIENLNKEVLNLKKEEIMQEVEEQSKDVIRQSEAEEEIVKQEEVVVEQVDDDVDDKDDEECLTKDKKETTMSKTETEITLEARISELEAIIESKDAEIAQLEKIKIAKLEADKAMTIDGVMSEVEVLFPSDGEEYKAIKAKGVSCDFKALSAWKIATMSKVATVALEKIKQMEQVSETNGDGVVFMSKPVELNVAKESIYD